MGARFRFETVIEKENGTERNCDVRRILRELKETLLNDYYNQVNNFPSNEKTDQIRKIQKRLENQPYVVIPTDKTNSVKTVAIEDYINWVAEHLKENGKEISRSGVVELHANAEEMLKLQKHILSKDEYKYAEETLRSKAIPVPKLLIKDHKTPDDKGFFPTRLVVPATNFTSCFPDLGYRDIKRIFDEKGMNYKSFTIIQAIEVKKKLELLGINKKNVTIASIDAVNMYPSIKFKLVREAIHFFAQDLPEEDQKTVDQCLELIKFGMNGTLLTFIDKYYEYDGDKDVEEKGLTIGG
jgi:hypothetical protein